MLVYGPPSTRPAVYTPRRTRPAQPSPPTPDSARHNTQDCPMATLEQLTGMGFSEDAAKAALEAHGSTDGALDALLGLVPHASTTQAKCKVQSSSRWLMRLNQRCVLARSPKFFFVPLLLLQGTPKGSSTAVCYGGCNERIRTRPGR